MSSSASSTSSRPPPSGALAQVANAMAKSMRDLYFANEDLLVFKSTGSQSLGAVGGHVTDTDCKPDYAAAFMSDWGGRNTTLWPCIRLVGLSTSESDVMFLLGIGGVGIHTFSDKWVSKELHRLIYAFIYRLYDLGDFVDLSYVEMVPDLEENSVTYNVQITEVNGMDRNPIMITNLHPIYASNPFGTRTHILSNPDSKVGAHPENEEAEPIGAAFWAELTGPVGDRIHLLRGGIPAMTDVTHSVYQPLRPLLGNLARILTVDRHWVNLSDPRNDPGYITEAFQRLIFQFILENRNEKFMQHRVESQPRHPKLIPEVLSLSSETSRKRSLSEPTTRGGTKRLRMAEEMIEDFPDGDESESQFAGEVEENWVAVDEEE
ncbi:hypothetical protein F5888DRAFT_1801442 [Russula emetica]|nr:hypothetical protein F5888DRAFT_1801442 [Russula emetica]